MPYPGNMDDYVKAFEWLEGHLELKLFQFAPDEVIAMIEQVVCQ